MRPGAETGHRVPAARCGRCIGRRTAAGTPPLGQPEPGPQKAAYVPPPAGAGTDAGADGAEVEAPPLEPEERVPVWQPAPARASRIARAAARRTRLAQDA